MKTAISLELIGDDFNEAIASILPSCVSRRPWVARLLGLDADFIIRARTYGISSKQVNRSGSAWLPCTTFASI
jgi:hypothetical protein